MQIRPLEKVIGNIQMQIQPLERDWKHSNPNSNQIQTIRMQILTIRKVF